MGVNLAIIREGGESEELERKQPKKSQRAFIRVKLGKRVH